MDNRLIFLYYILFAKSDGEDHRPDQYWIFGSIFLIFSEYYKKYFELRIIVKDITVLWMDGFMLPRKTLVVYNDIYLYRKLTQVGW
jgi:hypothetical protein